MKQVFSKFPQSRSISHKKLLVFIIINLVCLIFLTINQVFHVNAQAAGTGRLLGFSLTNTNNGTITTLVGIDPSTGAVTPLGQQLEPQIPSTQFNPSEMTLDSAGHRAFYIANKNDNNLTPVIVVQDTLTGAILNEVPADINFVDAGVDQMQYEPPTPPVISNLSSMTIHKGDTYTANGSFTDSNSTSWTATVNYGDNTGTNQLTLSGMNFSLSHIYNNLGVFTLLVNITGNDGLTGTRSALITVLPPNGLKGANLSGTNYSGSNLSNQDISGSNLQNGTFKNTNFQGSNLSGDNAPNASFQNANFTGANLAGSTFQTANFTGANLTNANLKGANFKNATMTNVICSNTICPNGTNSNNDNNTCTGQGGGL